MMVSKKERVFPNMYMSAMIEAKRTREWSFPHCPAEQQEQLRARRGQDPGKSQW